MKKLLIKLSGESLSNRNKDIAIDSDILLNIGHQIQQLVKQKYKIAIVVGGGNFWRGAQNLSANINRNDADYIGMLATTMNGIALKSTLQSLKLNARIYSSLKIDANIGEANNYQLTLSNFDKCDEIAIYTGGVGRPFFTTDTASILVASELGAKVLMAKNGVNGVYDKDPNKFDNATFFDSITYDDVLQKDIKVIDATAIAMAKNNNLEIIVFDINEKNSLLNAVTGKLKHTTIKG